MAGEIIAEDLLEKIKVDILISEADGWNLYKNNPSESRMVSGGIMLGADGRI